MRLTPFEAAAARRVTTEVAGAEARVLLFGSRTRDELRGGDIDLLVELPQASANLLALSLRIGARLQMALGERKIDVLVADPLSPDTPLLRAARREGIVL
jgi:predicted nucleotidyltransferase